MVGLRVDDRPKVDVPERVLVVDAAKALGEALVRLVSLGDLPAAYAHPDEVAQVAAGLRPTILLANASLRQERLEAIVASVRAASPAVRVVLVVDERERAHLSVAQQIGATACVRRHGDLGQVLRVVGRAMAPAQPPAHARASPMPGDPAVAGHRLHALTPRELDVLRAMAGGHSAAVIATALQISPNTLRKHVQNILGKLAVHSRFEAATVALGCGLRPLPLAKRLDP